MSEVLTASAVGQDDVDPDRVARGKPLKFVGGVPVYDSGWAPAFLRTKTQLRRVRRKPAVGQRPVAYIYTHWYGDRVALWDPEQSAEMRPLSALQRRQMQQRRTCTACGEVFPRPVWGMCGRREDREAQRRADLRRRTCHDLDDVLVNALGEFAQGVSENQPLSGPMTTPMNFEWSLRETASEMFALIGTVSPKGSSLTLAS